MTERDVIESDSVNKIVFATGGTNLRTLANLAPAYLTISGSDGKMLVALNLKDGSIEHGEGYTPTAAAQAFWAAMSSEYRLYLQQKESH